jgi:hypothetical protein
MEAQIAQSGPEDTMHDAACVVGEDVLLSKTGALPWLPELHGFEPASVRVGVGPTFAVADGHANGGECHTSNVHIASQPSSPADQAPRAHVAPLVCQPLLRCACARVRVPLRSAMHEYATVCARVQMTPPLLDLQTEQRRRAFTPVQFAAAVTVSAGPVCNQAPEGSWVCFALAAAGGA